MEAGFEVEGPTQQAPIKGARGCAPRFMLLGEKLIGSSAVLLLSSEGPSYQLREAGKSKVTWLVLAYNDVQL